MWKPSTSWIAWGLVLTAAPAWATEQLKQSSTQAPLTFMMIDSTDHISGKTGLSPTVTLSKAGGSFASPAGTVSEVGNGLYKVAGNATDTGTLGALWLHATATGADPTDVKFEIVATDPQDSTPSVDATQWGGTAVASARPKVDLYQILSTTLTEQASGNVAGTFSDFWDNNDNGVTTSVVGDIATIKGYIDTEVNAIKTKTDNLPSSPAAVGSAMTLASSAITTSTFATGAIDAAAIATDAGTELGTANWATTARTLTAATNITSSGGTITTSSGVVNVNVAKWLGTDVTVNVAGVPKVDITKVLGADASAVSGAIDVNVVKLIGNEIELTPP